MMFFGKSLSWQEEAMEEIRKEISREFKDFYKVGFQERLVGLEMVVTCLDKNNDPVVVDQRLLKNNWFMEFKDIRQKLTKFKHQSQFDTWQAKIRDERIQELKKHLEPFRVDGLLDVYAVNDAIRLRVNFIGAPGVLYEVENVLIQWPYDYHIDSLVTKLRELKKEKSAMLPKKRAQQVKIFASTMKDVLRVDVNEFLKDIALGKLAGNPVLKEIQPIQATYDSGTNEMRRTVMIIYEVDAE